MSLSRRTALLSGGAAVALGAMYFYACAPTTQSAIGAAGDAPSRVYVPPGSYDQYYAFMSGGFSGQLAVYGLPSGRLLKVIPVFAQLFAGLGAQLPYLTRMVVGASNFVGRYSIWILLGIVLVSVALRRWHKTYRGRRVLDGAMLRIPVIGELLRKIAIARFCRTLATLTSSGVPILEGLEITAKTSGNAIIEDAIMMVRRGVESGLTIAQPLKESNIFPAMVVQMIGVGEQTGALDAMLSKIADFYEEEVDQAVANMLTLMEPVMILFLGTTVGGIVIAMYLPLFDLISKLS